jgi:hypothetical protein
MMKARSNESTKGYLMEGMDRVLGIKGGMWLVVKHHEGKQK